MRDLASNRGGKWLAGDLIGELAMKDGDSWLDSGDRSDQEKARWERGLVAKLDSERRREMAGERAYGSAREIANV